MFKWLTAILVGCQAMLVLAVPPVEDFCFLHTSDNHIRPQPVGAEAPINEEGVQERFAWFCNEANNPQRIKPLKFTPPPPAFVICTGDLTEYGVVGKTWENIEAILSTLNIPFYLSPGNHDYTWGGMTSIMRKRYGGDHYSFDRFGCHFVCIATASIQEPLPSLERRTLRWLQADLAPVPKDVPVFLFFHHPLSSDEFVKPYEQLRLLEIIENHNIVLMMVGHKHRHTPEQWNRIDVVHGGTTERPLSGVGFNIIFVKDGFLHVVFRYRDPAKPMEILLEKPLTPTSRPELRFETPSPPKTSTSPTSDLVRVETGPTIPVSVRAEGGEPRSVAVNIDNLPGHWPSLERVGDGLYQGSVQTSGLLPGMHSILVSGDFEGEKVERSLEFLLKRPGIPFSARTLLNAGSKARPLIVGEHAIVTTTTGEMIDVSFDGEEASRKLFFDAGVEILHAPVPADGKLYFSAAEKGVHCIRMDGTLEWRREVGAMVHAAPAVDAERVYVADMEGHVHALDRATGNPIWSKHHAPFSIEMPITLHEDTLYFGAWDGLVYAVNASDGSLRWKEPGPTGQSDVPINKSRYYAPADCPPVVLADRLVICDRGYWVGAYNLQTGQYLGRVAKDVSAIGPAADGRGFYARGSIKGLKRFDEKCRVVWNNHKIAAGRLPVPPTAVGDFVFLCSNQGKLVGCHIKDGDEFARYQVTPQLRVMAPVAANEDGMIYVAAMDGSVTKLLTKR